LFDLRLEAVAH